MEELRNRFYYFMHNGFKRKESLLEEFFAFIDELEAIEEKNRDIYMLLVECYLQVYNVNKAVETFQKIYNPKDKKDMKKMVRIKTSYRGYMIRPSERSKQIPEFYYVKEKIIQDMFSNRKGEKCHICGKENGAYYKGNAYQEKDDNEYRVYFSEMEESYCAECLLAGKIAEKLNITFNSSYTDMNIGISEEKRKRLLKQTPCCDEEFGLEVEDGWPICCDDFAILEKIHTLNYQFRCAECGQVIRVRRE